MRSESDGRPTGGAVRPSARVRLRADRGHELGELTIEARPHGPSSAAAFAFSTPTGV